MTKAYLDKYYRFDDGDGRLHWRDNLCAAGTRQGESGKPWRGIDPAEKGMHWKFTIQRLDELDKEGRIYWPAKTGGMPQYKRYRDELKGLAISDIWDDIDRINPVGGERLGYPTQKPLALLERIIRSASNERDIVLDPFCGCGTAVEAAERLGRRWIGIDVTYLAIHVIETRLERAFGPEIKQRYEVHGRPRDSESARALAARNWLEFQKWAVMALGGLPKDRPGPDGGIDGIIRYHRVGKEWPNRAVVSVKGGVHVGVDAVHKLKSVVEREKAEMGVLVCLDPPTAAMVREVLSAGEIGPPSRRVYKLQIVTVDMLFQPHPVDLPGMIDLPEVGRPVPSPRSGKARRRVEGQTEMLLPIEGDQAGADRPKRRANRSIRSHDIEVTRAERRRKSEP